MREAEHFGGLALALEPSEAHREKVDWYVSAFLVALITIYDAARLDLRAVSSSRRQLAIIAEQSLSYNFDEREDPLGVVAFSRDLRNLRVHHRLPLVCLRRTVTEADIADDAATGRLRWYLAEVDGEAYHRMAQRDDQKNKRHIDLRRINEEFVAQTVLSDALGQMLYMVKARLRETSDQLDYA